MQIPLFTLNMLYLLGCCGGASCKYSPPPPCQVAHEEFSRRLRVNFKFYVLVYHTICVMVAFYLLNAANVFNFSIGTVLQ